jgi:hypothetical protein
MPGIMKKADPNKNPQKPPQKAPTLPQYFLRTDVTQYLAGRTVAITSLDHMGTDDADRHAGVAEYSLGHRAYKQLA